MPDPLASLILASVAVAAALALLRPRRGLAWRWRQGPARSERVLFEDALKHIQKCRMAGERATFESVAGILHVHVDRAGRLLERMQERGLVAMQGDEFRLTEAGRQTALHVIRAHRLYERYLADRTGFSETEWHDLAERYEHTVSQAQADALARALGNPTHDPHGDPIPTSAGNLVPHGGRPLTTMPVGEALGVVHIEDEPDSVYVRLVEERIHPGMEVRLLEASPHGVRFLAEGTEHEIPTLVAANITVVPLKGAGRTEGEEARWEPAECLSALRRGEKAQVLGISRACRGPERRRLMDLGILKGTPVEAEMASPAGDPTAYRIRGALVALHREQADLIHIERATPRGAAR